MHDETDTTHVDPVMHHKHAEMC